MTETLLVTGASGHLGRRVIDLLINDFKVAPSSLIATTRDPDRLADLAKQGVVVRKADFDDVSSLAQAFTGAQRLLLISTDSLGEPGRRLLQHKNAVEAAAKAGVAHVIYTSMPKPENSLLLVAPDHLETERALAASPLTWTVLRNNWYMENIFLNLSQVLSSGQWYSAAGDGRTAYIAREDCALAAAAVLVSGDRNKRTYTLTGKESFTTEAVAERISQLTGKPIAVIPVPESALVAGMVKAGLPEFFAEVFASFDTNTRAGGVADITQDVAQLIGRPPQSFEDWLAANRAAFTGES